jgi:hypothetical protein
MLRVALLCLFVAPVVVAAPVPPPTEQEQIAKHWGKVVASPGCEFKLLGKSLTVRTDGVPTRGLIENLSTKGEDRCKMPRVARTVAGDFELTLKLTDAAAPIRDARHQESWPMTRAGLFISGGGYGTELHLKQYYTKINGAIQGDLVRTVWVDSWYPGGGSGSSMARVEPNKSVYLRIVRKDKTVSVSSSPDGKDWTPPRVPRQEMPFPAEVTVGVFVNHSTHQFAEATFAEFTVGIPPKGEKK